MDLKFATILTAALSLLQGTPLFGEDIPIFAEQTVNKQSLYVGEQAIYELSINTRAPILDFQPPELTLQHAWTETIAVNQRLRRVIQGETWGSYVTRRAVYPLSSGEFKFPALNIPVGIRVRTKTKAILPFGFEDAFSDQIIEQFFAEYTRKEVSLQAAETKIEIKPLPLKPDNLAPYQAYIPVGASHLSAQFSASEITLGESLSLQVTVISTGSLNPIKELTLDLPNTIRVYNDKIKDEKSENNGALISRKSFLFSLVPRAAGVFTIPPIRLAYFDPDKNIFQIAESNPFKLTVYVSSSISPPTEATPQVLSPTHSAPTSDVSSPIEPSPAITVANNSSRFSSESKLFIATLILLLLALTGIAMRLFLHFLPIARARRSIRATADRFQLAHTIRHILQCHFSVPQRDYSPEEWRGLLNLQSLPSNLRFRLLSLVEELEQPQSTYDGADQVTLQQKSEASQVISAILKGSIN